jgi:hypothetical protein
VIDEDTHEFVKEAWTSDTFHGLSKRYFLLSQMVSEAATEAGRIPSEFQKKLRRQLVLLGLRARRYPKLEERSAALVKKFDGICKDAGD